MIRAVIFDLDDTLIDTSRLLIPIRDDPSFFQVIQRPLPLFAGVMENLTYLEKRYYLFLVTYGEVVVQKQKLKSTGIEPFFREVYFCDSLLNENKKYYFEKILRNHALAPETVISFGNRVVTDLIPANELGMQTCLYNYGEHRYENERTKFFRPDWTIDRQDDFLWSCGLLEGSPKKV